MHRQAEAQSYSQKIYQFTKITLSKQQYNIQVQKKSTTVLQRQVMQRSHNLHSFKVSK